VPEPKPECGACNACCVIPLIDCAELEKPFRLPCPHLCGNCSIYASRPQVCRQFECLYRQSDWLAADPQNRPDVLGIMFSATAATPAARQVTGRTRTINCFETRAGAAQEPRPAELIETLLEQFPAANIVLIPHEQVDGTGILVNP
jgi:hypothetical protein